ncbi:MAG: MATE family efflux transporter [Firmicutes bacterium]|nr:MATE family efflux transporter [Bacillota bacterium]
MEQNERLAKESIPRLLLHLSLPAVTAQVINALYNIVDRMYIGRIAAVGTDALTGVGITFPIIMIISAFASLIGMGGAPFTSIKMGEKDHDGAERILGNCTALLTVISVILTVVLLLVKQPLLYLFGASDATFLYANDYLSIYLTGTLAVQLSLGLNSFITAQGFASTAMATVLIGAICNIVLDPVFIFLFGMGVKGAALATVISQTVSAAWVLCFLNGKKALLRIRRKFLALIAPDTGRVLALGLSPFIMQSTESLIQICFNVTLKQFGTDLDIGAMVILTSVMQMVLMPLTGVTQGAQPIIGYNYGAKNYTRVKSTIKYVVAICCSYAVLIWTLCIFFPRIPCSIFSGDEHLVPLAAGYMKTFCFGILLFGLQIAFQNSFVALGNAKYSIFLALLRKIVLLIPLTLILPRAGLGVYGVFLAEPIADICAALTTTTIFLLSARKFLNPTHSSDE